MRDKKRLTREEIRRAIQRIEHRRPKRIPKERCRMNISTVAREAGISAASIHNTYPDIAEVITATPVVRFREGIVPGPPVPTSHGLTCWTESRHRTAGVHRAAHWHAGRKMAMLQFIACL